MTRSASLVLIGLVLVVGLCSPRASTASPGLPASTGERRFALVAGNDEGGPSRQRLLFAREDAKKVHDILLRLGDVRPGDATLLLEAQPERFLAALEELEARARAARDEGLRTVLFVYYSGHAREEGLELGGSVVSMADLRARLSAGAADVRIAVFDACRSGAVIRRKGVVRAPALKLDTGADRQARGLVILTSSAEDEDSQESDLLGGSYFTHHLASALLGDADQSGDGRVTVGEAYAHAYQRTVADTAGSWAGTQHPAYSFDLAGTADVVLTYLSARSEGAYLPPEAPPGVYFLVDAGGFVAAEVAKAPGVARTLALAPGTYRVKRRTPLGLQVGALTVRAGKLTTFDGRDLTPARFSDDPVKGPVRLAFLRPHLTLGVGALYQLMFGPDPTRGGLFPSGPLVVVGLEAHNALGRGWSLSVEALGGAGRARLSSPRLGERTYRHQQLGLAAALLAEWPEAWLVPFLGPRLNLTLWTRDLDDGTRQWAMLTSPGVEAGLRLRLSRGLTLSSRARGHYLFYRTFDETLNQPYLELGGTLSYRPGE